jgi:hypothetical protein
MRHGSARKVLLFVALVALGIVIGIVLTRPARPQTVNLPGSTMISNATEATIPASRRLFAAGSRSST